jgi:hypothetical protein
MKTPNPKFTPLIRRRSDANARHLKAISGIGHCPDFDADIRSEIEGVIQARPNSFSRTRRHRIPTSVKDKRV